jgi:deoxyribonuclease-4
VGSIRVGFHVSIAGGISNSVDNARKIGCSAFQIFSRSPQRWETQPLVPDDVQQFKTKLAASGIARDSVILHMPYLPNLAGPGGEKYKKSVETLAGEIDRCIDLGIRYLVIHLGSHMGEGTKNGIDQLVKAIDLARDKSSETKGVTLLLENSTGKNNTIGGNFEELRLILDKLGSSREFGVCLDTCHAFASGYDLRSKEKVANVLENLDKAVGVREIRVLHLNDSKDGLGSHLDRHARIGQGRITTSGFSALIGHKTIRNLPMIMETPTDKLTEAKDNLQVVMRLAGVP